MLRQCELRAIVSDRRNMMRACTRPRRSEAGARLETDAVVYRLETDDSRRISAVFFRRSDGSAGSAKGRIVVLAANAVETPKLLLMSRHDRMPKGVANSSDTVGRYLMSQIDQVTRGLTQVPIYPYRGPVLTSAISGIQGRSVPPQAFGHRNVALK